MKTNWKPKRRGYIYCSSACGGGCTWEGYKRALKDSKAVAEQLGPKWKANVWENLGWHWSVDAAAGKYFVSVRCDGKRYSCMISTHRGCGTPGLYDDRDYDTPVKAAAASIAVFLTQTSDYQYAGITMFNMMRHHWQKKL